MITAQDIREKTFEKSKFGGYDMASVDEFLEAIADDLSSAQKESSVLKSKIKVLVDKIEEYRSNESALNQAVLSAQKLAVQIESEARAKAEKMIADADAQVKEKLGSIDEQADFETRRLEEARASSAKFFDGIRAMCAAQLKNIEKLSAEVCGSETAAPEKATVVAEESTKVVYSAPKAEPAPKHAVTAADEDFTRDVEEAVRSIEASVSRIQPEPSVQFDFSDDMDAPFSQKESENTLPFTL